MALAHVEVVFDLRGREGVRGIGEQTLIRFEGPVVAQEPGRSRNEELARMPGVVQGILDLIKEPRESPISGLREVPPGSATYSAMPVAMS